MDTEVPPFRATFGVLEQAFAEMHGIADSKRTAFRARLKNFHRLGFPLKFQSTKGRANAYAPGAVVDMALALEMTQLGLTPERVVHVLALNQFPTTMAVRFAASYLIATPQGFDPHRVLETDPPSTFLYFDPSALRSLTLDDPDLTPDIDEADDTYFYSGGVDAADNLIAWTSGHRNRISFINVTAMIDRIAAEILAPHAETMSQELLNRRKSFFAEIHDDAAARNEETYDHDASYYLQRVLDQRTPVPSDMDDNEVNDLIRQLVEETGMKPITIRDALDRSVKSAGANDG